MKVGFYKDYVYTVIKYPNSGRNATIICRSDEHKQIYYGYSEDEACQKFALYLNAI